MGFFNRRETPTEEFLHIYTHLHQIVGWTHGHIPPPFRAGISEQIMQKTILDWSRRNATILDELSRFRQEIMAHNPSPGKIKASVNQAKKVTAEIEQKLRDLGREL